MSRLHRGGLIASLAIGFLQTPLPAFAQAVASAPMPSAPMPSAPMPSAPMTGAPMTGAPVPIEDTSVVEPLIVQEEPAPPVAADAAPACRCGDKACVKCDKKKKDALAAKVKDAYKGVFYANDFSYINDPGYTQHYPGDALKQMSVPGGGKLDVGGEIRVRYHSEENHRGLGLTGRDDEFWLTRLRLFANYRVNDWLRMYGEFIYADSAGEVFNNRNIEENRGDAQNLLFDAKLFDDGDSKVTARVGRQELIYGNERLISPLDWANTRRTFDGYKLMYSGAKWDADGFFVHPTNRLLTNEDKWDSTDFQTDFYGLYTQRKGLDIGAVDFYYLGLDYQAFNSNVHTFGTRLAGSKGSVLYETEGGVQVGDTSTGANHQSEFFTAGLGRKLELNVGASTWKPTVWAWYDYASGGDTFPGNRFDDGFDHLFPLGHKYIGFIDLFGRRNISDFNAQLLTPIGGDRVNLLVWYHYLMLNELTTPYNVNLSPFNSTTAAADRELGHEIDVLFNIAINPRNSAQLGYSFFDSGKYYTETSGGVAGTNGIPSIGDAQFLYAAYQMRF